MDVLASRDERGLRRTVKSCGPDPPTLGSGRSNRDVGPMDRHAGFVGDGGYQARHTGESTKQPLKPLRREGRVAPVEPVVSNSCAFYLCTRGYGCSQHPAFPAPSMRWRGSFAQNLGRLASRDDRCWGAPGSAHNVQLMMVAAEPRLLRPRNSFGRFDPSPRSFLLTPLFSHTPL
jgi:hypothetical protein